MSIISADIVIDAIMKKILGLVIEEDKYENRSINFI